MTRRSSRPRIAVSLVLLTILMHVVLMSDREPAQPAPVRVMEVGNLRAFPGADGFGAFTRGGRGGRVIIVTTLADSGPGSFRDAVTAQGPRIVVFAVGGIIDLQSHINVMHPFLTIAGQTALGDGIVLRGWTLRLEASEIIVRGMRFRPGDGHRDAGEDVVDGVSIGSEDRPLRNVVLDHNSMSWAVDENIDIWYRNEDVTVSWNVAGEALVEPVRAAGGRIEGGKGMLIGQDSERVSVHHNLFAHNNERNPLVKGASDSEIVNNVVYDWGNFAVNSTDEEGLGPPVADVEGNYFRSGRSTRNEKAIDFAAGSYYARGNVGAGDNGGVQVASRSCLLPQTAAMSYREVLDDAGATAPQRDAVDRRIVDDVLEGTGSILGSQNDVGGWPIYRSGVAPRDTDRDGMPDTFEEGQGLDPGSGIDALAIAPSGYPWIEEYVNSLLPAERDVAGSTAGACHQR